MSLPPHPAKQIKVYRIFLESREFSSEAPFPNLDDHRVLHIIADTTTYTQEYHVLPAANLGHEKVRLFLPRASFAMWPPMLLTLEQQHRIELCKRADAAEREKWKSPVYIASGEYERCGSEARVGWNKRLATEVFHVAGRNPADHQAVWECVVDAFDTYEPMSTFESHPWDRLIHIASLTDKLVPITCNDVMTELGFVAQFMGDENCTNEAKRHVHRAIEALLKKETEHVADCVYEGWYLEMGYELLACCTR